MSRVMPLDEQEPSPREKMRREWTIACVGGDTDLGFEDWINRGVGGSTPTRRHTPPEMDGDGVFVFHDVFIEGCTLEVVPQLSGNVEITVAYKEDGTPEDGALFSLSLFDRANLLQALLHDFHYGPEIGGPADDAEA